MKLNAIRDQFRVILLEFFLTPEEALFFRLNASALKEVNSKRKVGTKKLNVFFQMPESYGYLFLFSSAIRDLASHFNLEVNWAQCHYWFKYSGKLAFLKRFAFYQRRWSKLYRSNGGQVIYSQMFQRWAIPSKTLHEVDRVYSSLKSKEDLVALSYQGIVLGDLIYDSYLRFKPAPTVDLSDPYLKEMICHSFHAVNQARETFLKHKIDFYFTSYCTYIHHGVLVRVALAMDVRVIALGDDVALSREVLPAFPTHARDHSCYASLFSHFTEEEKRVARELSHSQLELRFAGKIDLSTSYMRESAYKEVSETAQRVLKPSSKKKIVFFFHCFFDSPHVYRSMLFPDFYEWIIQSFNFILKNNLHEKCDFYFKAHPNGRDGNDEIVEQIRLQYPRFIPISKDVSNMQLISEGLDLAMTVHGTLGHEFPYFGIPVLNAGDNPHVNYDFCITPKTKKEFFDMLFHADQIRAPDMSAKNKIYEFYYIHKFFTLPGQLKDDRNIFVYQFVNDLVYPENFNRFIQSCEKNRSELFAIDSLMSDSLKFFVEEESFRSKA